MEGDNDSLTYAQKSLRNLTTVGHRRRGVCPNRRRGHTPPSLSSGVEIWDMLKYLSSDVSNTNVAQELNKVAVHLRGIRRRVTGEPAPDRLEQTFTKLEITDKTVYKACAQAPRQHRSP